MTSTEAKARVAPTAPPFDIGNSFHVTGTFAQSPAAFGAYIRFINALSRDSELDMRTREIIILTMGAKLGAEYEWRRHSIRALEEGITEQELLSLRAGDYDCFSAAEQATIRFAVAFDGCRVTDEVWSDFARHYSDSLAVEISTWAGMYGLVCRFLLAMRVEMDDDIADSPSAVEGTHS
jgi:alkylhydroperoxidase/carboxymuconolactone decarboxylase family protein YurZ